MGLPFESRYFVSKRNVTAGILRRPCSASACRVCGLVRRCRCKAWMASQQRFIVRLTFLEIVYVLAPGDGGNVAYDETSKHV